MFNCLHCIIENCSNPKLIFLQQKLIKYEQLIITFPKDMATRNKRKLAELIRENCEEHARSNLAQTSKVPRSQEDYITQVSEETEGRVTKMLSQEFSRTQNCILRALARLDDFLMNPLIQGHSGTAPETARNAFIMNKERMRTTPRVIFILKQASYTPKRHETRTHKMASTW